MNRKLNFRAWDTKDKRFLEYFRDFWQHPDSSLESIFHNDRFVWQQFTGLKDIHGTDIYEGDIITYIEKMHEHGDAQKLRGVIVYDEENAAFGLAGLESGEIWNYFTDMVISDFEVVGNIFEGGGK